MGNIMHRAFEGSITYILDYAEDILYGQWYYTRRIVISLHG